MGCPVPFGIISENPAALGQDSAARSRGSKRVPPLSSYARARPPAAVGLPPLSRPAPAPASGGVATAERGGGPRLRHGSESEARSAVHAPTGWSPAKRASERREQAVRSRGRSAPWISLRFYCSPQLRRTCPPRAQPGADERGGAGARGSGLDSDVYSNVKFFIIFFDYG